MSDDVNENLFLHAIRASTSVNALQHEMSESFWRDWFAGRVLSGAIAEMGIDGIEDKIVAQRCYELADEMLEARRAR